MVKIGDKVRFLNSVGGGVVRAFQGKNTVLVEDDSGFDFPLSLSECVVVGEANPVVRPAPAAPTPQQNKPVPAPRAQAPERPSSPETPEGERLSVYLAFLPLDPKAPMQSGYEAYFVNASNYHLFFTYSNRQNNSWMCRYQGAIEPNTKIFIEEFGKEALNDLERVYVQLIAFKKNKPFSLKNTYSVELRLDTVKFYKIHCFLENDFFDEDALVFPIVRADVPEKQLLVSATELQEALMQKKEYTPGHASAAKKVKKAQPALLEIDLHIGQLLDQTGGMAPADILQYQLEKFHAVLKEYGQTKGQQIVFIHGKGEGVLRAAIEKELKTRYKAYTFQDASFQEYGFGATLVKIH